MKHPGILIAMFLLLLALIGGLSAYAFVDTASISTEENRTLTSRPTLTAETWFSGEFATQAEDFLSDHIYKRASLVDAAQRVEALMERKSEIKLVVHDAAEMGAASVEPADGEPVAAGTTLDAEAAQSAASEEADSEANDAQRLVLEDRVLSVYQDAPDNLTYYATVANSLFAMFPDYVNKCCIVAPSRIAFETDDVRKYSDDQRSAIEFVYAQLDSLVTTVDVYSVLEANSTRLDDLYFRTDHHWTHLSAYHAAATMFETLGQPYTPLDAYERKEGDTFLGYYYAQDRSATLEEHRDELIYYMPKDHDVPQSTLYIPNADGVLEAEVELTINPLRGGYYTFAGSSFAYAVSEGVNKGGGCLLLIADSYGNALSTWLAENYTRVIQLDPRDYTDGREGLLALAEEYGVTDVLLCDYLGAIDSPYFPSQIKHLTESKG